MATICYPAGTDWSCRFTELELSQARAETPDLIERAEALAWNLLSSLTGNAIPTCPITVRPCARNCVPNGGLMTAPVAGGGVGMMNPYISSGKWYNACGCRSVDDCGCSNLSEVKLFGPVGAIESIYVDGSLVPKTAYRVYNGNILVRTDGGTWPVCQDYALDDHDGFSVTYYAGPSPNTMTLAAAGALASEFYDACTGADCRLPGNVTSVSRGGMSYEVEPANFPDGVTGIPVVDAVVRIYNPYLLKTRPKVSAPGSSRGHRVQTWK